MTVRFSDSTGIPNLPDGSALANPHGMAIKFHIPDGGETDMVINSLKFFPVSSGADFRDMLLAVAESPPGAPKPTKLEQFAANYPNMPRAVNCVASSPTLPCRRVIGNQQLDMLGAAIPDRRTCHTEARCNDHFYSPVEIDIASVSLPEGEFACADREP